MIDDLDIIARMVNFTYRGSSLAKFADDLRAARYKRVKITAVQRWIILERQESTCKLCAALGPFEFDHIVPGSAGGTAELENYQALCATCYQKKCEQKRQT
jgi:5-methylcytosine-specific restriction endonuclease McrA